MKTKEAILESSIEKKKNSGAEYSKESVQDAVLEAMSEYAKQQVLSFDRWLRQTLPTGQIKDLYAQFLKHQQNNESKD